MSCATARDSAALIQSNMERAGELVHSFKEVSADQARHERRRFELGSHVEESLPGLRMG